MQTATLAPSQMVSPSMSCSMARSLAPDGTGCRDVMLRVVSAGTLGCAPCSSRRFQAAGVAKRAHLSPPWRLCLTATAAMLACTRAFHRNRRSDERLGRDTTNGGESIRHGVRSLESFARTPDSSSPHALHLQITKRRAVLLFHAVLHMLHGRPFTWQLVCSFLLQVLYGTHLTRQRVCSYWA